MPSSPSPRRTRWSFSSAYRLIGKLVYDRMSSLGYFDEVRQELGLDKTTQDILKNNPQYFENILNAM